MNQEVANELSFMNWVYNSQSLNNFMSIKFLKYTTGQAAFDLSAVESLKLTVRQCCQSRDHAIFLASPFELSAHREYKNGSEHMRHLLDSRIRKKRSPVIDFVGSSYFQPQLGGRQLNSETLLGGEFFARRLNFMAVESQQIVIEEAYQKGLLQVFQFLLQILKILLELQYCQKLMQLLKFEI